MPQIVRSAQLGTCQFFPSLLIIVSCFVVYTFNLTLFVIDFLSVI